MKSPQGFEPSIVGSHSLGAALGPRLTPAHTVSTYCSQKKAERQDRPWQQFCSVGTCLFGVLVFISCSGATMADNYSGAVSPPEIMLVGIPEGPPWRRNYQG